MSRLPAVVREIAEVIGRDDTLKLIGLLPRRRLTDPRYPNSSKIQTCLYVPKTLPADHWLVRVLGWKTAKRLSDIYGGELIKPPACEELYRAWRNEEIVSMSAKGVPIKEIACITGITTRMVATIIEREKETV